MRDHRITDGQTAALLDGHVPEGREDLEPLAAAVDALRLAWFEAPPQPSAELAARLDLDRLAWISAARGTGVPERGVERTAFAAPRPARSRIKTAFGWFTGLGIAAQLALGAGAVSAGAAGIGMTGALPPVAQDMFDAVVETVASVPELLDAGFGRNGADASAGQVTDDARTGVDGADEAADGSAPTGEAPTGADDGQPTADRPGSATGSGKPADAGRPDGAGMPDHAGKPGNPGKPAESGEPESAGKPGRVGEPETGAGADSRPGEPDSGAAAPANPGGAKPAEEPRTPGGDAAGPGGADTGFSSGGAPAKPRDSGAPALENGETGGTGSGSDAAAVPGGTPAAGDTENRP